MTDENLALKLQQQFAERFAEWSIANGKSECKATLRIATFDMLDSARRIDALNVAHLEVAGGMANPLDAYVYLNQCVLTGLVTIQAGLTVKSAAQRCASRDATAKDES